MAKFSPDFELFRGDSSSLVDAASNVTHCNAAVYITARFPVEMGIIDAVSFVKPRLTVNSYLPHPWRAANRGESKLTGCINKSY